MKKILTPRRHAVPLMPGERPSTEEERLAAIAEGRRAMVASIQREFPQVKVLGIEGRGEILVDLPDGEPDLLARLRASLDVESGPAPDEDPQMPKWRYDVAPTTEAIEEARRGGEYRPTVVAVVRDRRRRFLMLRSRFDETAWMFVQGGIEKGETAENAAKRELGEETGADPETFVIGRYVGTVDLDAETGRTDKRGFAKGKRYFIYEMEYDGPEEIEVQRDEIDAYEWIQPHLADPRLLEILAGMRVGKGRLMIGAILRIL